MANIHISLVGGQTTPAYLGIMDTNPDKVVLVYSDQTIDEANRISNEIQIDCELKKFHPVELKDIEKGIENIQNELKADDTISLNIGGGTKPWSILFYDYFKDLDNSTIFYIDQNNTVWNLKNRTKHEVTFNMDVQFRLYGNPLTKYISFSDYTDADKKVLQQIRELRQFKYSDFHFITDYLYRFPNETSKESVGGSVITWLPLEKTFLCSMKNKKGKELYYRLNSDNIRNLLLNTGWFEYEIANILSGWKYSKEIRLNCVFPASKGSPKNEIDIIINTGTKLLFIECKTQINNETDIDKFASAVKVYGGLGSKALFITDAPMSEKAREKCNDHGIMNFSLQNNLLGLPVDKMLFVLLEKELFNINAK